MTDKEDVMELKSCPFCGGEGEAIGEGRRTEWAVFCKSCDAKTMWLCEQDGGKAEAIKAWNRRASSASQDKVVEGLREALEAIVNDDESCGDSCATRMQRVAGAALARLTAAPEGKPCIHGGVDLCWDVKCDGFHRPTAPGKGE